ncbi:related to uracil permease [Phialocephala subalpina]|uniref:Related to uracil permease n=1 Tax=Phialocephala subalpina TaxID=576137 RepID=A0A1L7XFK1_9HELO|nr:related to uracil permease [Phialocephala subalpina]
MTMSYLKRVRQLLEVTRDTDTEVNSYINKDTRPLPPSRRTYGPWSFVALWMVTGSFNVGGWTTGSTLISLGLNVWQSMLAVILSQTFVGFVCILGGHPGAKWHIGFPFWMRAVWGSYGAYFPMANRVFLSFIYTATNTWYGGQCVKVLLTAIWPSFQNIGHELAGGTMTTADFVAFIVFLVACTPMMWISPERFRLPFLISCIAVVPTVLTLLIWSMAEAGGGGSLIADMSTVSGVKQATGSLLGWKMMAGITASIGGIATHMFSQSDYTRYARKPKDQYLAQLIMVPLGAIIVAAVGIVCTSCAAQLYPETTKLLWQPYAFLSAVQKYNNNSHRSRAGVAFASISFIFSQFGIVVASNAVVAGIDLAAIFPRYFTIRRGGYLTVLFVFIMQPWQLLNSASIFLTVVGGYASFLGPFMGVQFADYFLLRQQNLKLTDLYEMSPKSIYWYSRGVNWRAPVAFVLGLWMLLPGFAEHVRQPTKIWNGWTHMYWIAWFLGCFVSGGIYVILDFVFPMQHKGEIDDQDYFGTFTEIETLEGSSRDSGVEEMVEPISMKV